MTLMSYYTTKDDAEAALAKFAGAMADPTIAFYSIAMRGTGYVVIGWAWHP